MSLRKLERESIEGFLKKNKSKLTGRVLDYGSGKQPYKGLVELAGGQYVPFDDPRYPGSCATEPTGFPVGQFDTVICTQVLQYVDNPLATLATIKHQLKIDGHLLITGPTNWPVIEDDDKWRFTVHGIALLLIKAGFHGTQVQERAHVSHEQERWCLGWAALGRA